MTRIAIIGAGGFVGNSLAESLVLDGEDGIRAVIRAPRNLAGLCRFGSAIVPAFADAEDSAALTNAVAGATTVVNVTTGPPAGIVRSTLAIHSACLNAGVSRLVHLSSAVVYGDMPTPVATDDEPPSSRHWMPYARAKAAAENWLRPRLNDDRLDVLVLRPGIVWGIRSPHTIELVRTLVRKTAFLVDGGKGIFNGIFIDNLVAAIRNCCDHPGRLSGYFNVGDPETISWREFFDGLAAFLDFDPSRLPVVSGKRFPWSVRAGIDYVQSLRGINALYHRFKARLPDGWKAAVKSHLAGGYDYERVAPDYAKAIVVDRELWHLQRVKHKLPTTRFTQTFGSPPVSYSEAMARTLDWLSTLGYGRAHHVHSAHV